jgi:hypothetical protein
MKQKYKDWIEKNILDSADGLCLEWSGLMAQEFPELELVEGYVHFKEQEKIGHFWCIDEDFEIVDPTVVQFGFIPSHYEFVKHPKQTGDCIICGSPTYLGNKCCSVYCYSEDIEDKTS